MEMREKELGLCVGPCVIVDGIQVRPQRHASVNTQNPQSTALFGPLPFIPHQHTPDDPDTVKNNTQAV